MRTRWFLLGSALAVLVLTLAGGYLRSATREEPGLKDLAKDRIVIARRALDMIEQLLKAPAAGAENPILSMERLEQRIAWSRRWMESRLDLSDTREARGDAIRDHIKRLGKWLPTYQELARLGATSGVSQSHVDLLEYAILEAKAALLKDSAAAK